MSGYWTADLDIENNKFEEWEEIFDYINENTDIYTDYEEANYDDACENTYDYWDLVSALRDGQSWESLENDIYDRLYEDFRDEYYSGHGEDIVFDDGPTFVWVEEEEEEEE